MTLPPWVHEDLLANEPPDYHRMDDPWGHADLVYTHIGEAVLMLRIRLDVLTFNLKKWFFDEEDYERLRQECKDLISWCVAVSGRISDGDPWVPLTTNGAAFLSRFGELKVTGPSEVSHAYDRVRVWVTGILSSISLPDWTGRTHGDRPTHVTSLSQHQALRDALHIAAASFQLEQDMDDRGAENYFKWSLAPSHVELLVWPVATVDRAKLLWEEGSTREAGEECFALVAGAISRRFGKIEEEYDPEIITPQVDFFLDNPGYITNFTAWRGWLAEQMDAMNAPGLAQALRMPMSDDNFEFDAAINILNEAIELVNPNMHLFYEEGNLFLDVVADDEDGWE